MPDFPTPFVWPPAAPMMNLHTSLGSEFARLDGNLHVSTNTGAWPSANRAYYWPFQVGVTVTAYQMAILVITQSGNLDVGIYDENANRLVSMGSTAVGAAGIQTFDIANTVLTPGTYFAAMCVDNITASFGRISAPDVASHRAIGTQQQAVGAVTLPDPATFASPTAGYVAQLTIYFQPTAG